MLRLQDLMDNFQKEPNNAQIKEEYFAALKDQYGSDEDVTENPYNRQRENFANHRYHTQSPNNLYPYDRKAKNYGFMANTIYREQVPKDEFLDSRSKSYSPERDLKNLNRVGKETQAKRLARNLKENTKSIQCDLFVNTG